MSVSGSTILFPLFSLSKDLPPSFVPISSKLLQAIDPGKASIAKFGDDVLVEVLEAVEVVHAPSLSTLRLVSSKFNFLAEYVGTRTLKLKIKESHNADVAEHLDRLERKGLFPAVRVIEAARSGNSAPLVVASEGLQENIDRGFQRFSQMTGLRDVKLTNGGLTPQFCAELKRLPYVRLHVTLQSYSHGAEVEHFLGLLQGNANLHALNIEHTYFDASGCLAVTQPLKEVLLSSPRLRELCLDIGMPTGGCCVYEPPIEYCGLGFANGEKPQALEKLNVKRYPFGYDGHIDEVSYWATTFDWSRLKNLVTPNVHTALRLMPHLTALEGGTIGYGTSEDEANFYLNVPSILKTIAVKTLRGIGIDGILRHGPALEDLRIHQVESHEWEADAISLETLSTFRRACPNLETLHIDINRSSGNTTWPYQHLDVLASFPRLQHLTLHFELGVCRGKTTLEPKVTFASAQHLFQYLRARSTRLQQLDIYSGAPPPLGFGFPSPEAFWPERNSMHFRCTPAVRDDLAAQGEIVCECPKLSKIANETLRGEPRHDPPVNAPWTYLDEGSIKVARDGPVSLSEWDNDDF